MTERKETNKKAALRISCVSLHVETTKTSIRMKRPNQLQGMRMARWAAAVLLCIGAPAPCALRAAAGG